LRERHHDEEVIPLDHDDVDDLSDEDKSRTLVNETINVSKIDLVID